MSLSDRLAGAGLAALIALLRLIPLDAASAACGRLARTIGPLLPVHRVGETNLRAAFPEKDDAWIRATLRGAWDNLGRVAGEYVHLREIWDFDPTHPERSRLRSDDLPVLDALRDDGLPCLCFAAHLANWELPAVAAHKLGLPSAVLYRMPNNRAVADQIARIRGGLMGRLIRSRREAVFEMASALEAGEHLGMLVDQHFSRGPVVTFFGRKCRANPTLARLARQQECPVVGVRVIRLGGVRFEVKGEMLELPRDADGQLDVDAATQAVASVVERWVREHPEQWLWFHRRWR
jgi:KDO2-lipid IV(A) lauroyltransferase